nr:hypothetical protein OG409_34930 [Streptomyces sp. NBC_00974]
MSGGPAWTNAVGADLFVSCMFIPTWDDFINHEMWMTTRDNLVNPARRSWLEGGMTAGTVRDANGVDYTGFQWFWADQRSNSRTSDYHEHMAGWADTGTWENISFYWRGNGNWDVYRSGNWVGMSIGVGDWAGGAEIGMESTSLGVTGTGFSRYMQYADPSGNWHWAPDWFSNPDPQLYTNGSFFGIPAVSTLNGCPAGVSASAGEGAGAKPAPAPQPSPEPSPAGRDSPEAAGPVVRPSGTTVPGGKEPNRKDLVEIAQRIAAKNGDGHPKNLKVVKTKRKAAAQAVSGAAVNSDQDAFVVEMTGKFTAHQVKVPHGGPQPTGSTLTLTIDANTGLILDWGLTTGTPTPTRLGTFSPLS